MADEIISFTRLSRTEESARLISDAFMRNQLPRNDAVFRWQYLETPAKRSLVLGALSAARGPGHLAAIYATLPLWMKVGNRRVLALQSFDTMTDAEFRGKGLFIRLAKAVYDDLAPAEGYEGIFGTPNGNSAHGIFDRLGWTKLDPVPFLARPLRTGPIFERVFRGHAFARLLPDISLSRGGAPQLGPHQSLDSMTAFGPEVDTLWSRFSAEIDIAVWRDSEYLQWRVRRPDAGYLTLALRERGLLLGLVIFDTGEKHADRFGHIAELMIDPSRPDAGRVLLTAAIRAMAAAGAPLAMAWNLPTSPNHRCFRHTGFLPVPARFHPIETHFGARSFGLPSPLWTRREGWYLSYLDSDTC